jgi:hypothetical protein
MLLNLYRSLWSYRGFILGSVKREFQSRYRNSLFGALWTVIFSHIMRARLPGVALLNRNFEWRDYGLVFHVINNRHEDFVGCSWLGAKTTITRTTTQSVSEIAS